jgi:hypothetical protein
MRERPDGDLNPQEVGMIRISSSLSRPMAGAALVGLALMAACNLAEGPVPLMTQVQADSLAQAVAADVGDLSEGNTFDAATGVSMTGSAGIAGAPELCVSRSPASPTNSDGDPVPDSVRITYSNCVYSNPWHVVTVDGILDVVDPTATTTDHGIKTVYTDLIRRDSSLVTDRARSVKANGTRTVIGDSSAISRTETDFTTTFYFANGDSAEHVKTWSSSFVADTAGSIQRDQPLPSGHWTVTGNSTWTHGARSYSLAVTTNPALHFNAACTVAPRFDAGTVAAVATRQNASGSTTINITIQFTACGQYTVTRS